MSSSAPSSRVERASQALKAILIEDLRRAAQVGADIQ
jgi:hypothetical protein